MQTFGGDWKAETSEPTTAHATEAPVKSRGGFFNKCVLLGSAVMAAIVMVLVILHSGGRAPAGGTPKAIVFVIEGFKGTLFQPLVMDGFRAPNLKALMQSGSGQFAMCTDPGFPGCARAQSGPLSKRMGAGATWTAAPGIVSIATGVDVDKHGVTNTTLDSLLNWQGSRYPSFLASARAAGFRTGAVGSASMLTAIATPGGSCSALGALDFECGSAMINRCYSPESCNLDKRVSIPTAVATGEDQARAAEDIEALLDSGLDIAVIHFNNLIAAATQNPEDGSFSADSAAYAAALYRIDALIGQALALVRRRAYSSDENWLVVGVADHGGKGRGFGQNEGDDEVVAFFESVISALGTLTLEPLPDFPRQYDVAPTVLKWFGLYTEAAAARMDGRPQGVCTDGKMPKNCTSDEAEASAADSAL